MRSMVRTLRGDWLALDVDGATTTVAQVKGMVMARERIAVAMQRLFFAGRCLDDDQSTLADYGVRHDSVVFLSLHLATDAYQSIYSRKEMWLMQPETTTTKKEMHQQQLLHVHVAAADEEKVIKRKPVSRRALRKILSRLQVDAWTSQHDAGRAPAVAKWPTGTHDAGVRERKREGREREEACGSHMGRRGGGGGASPAARSGLVAVSFTHPEGRRRGGRRWDLKRRPPSPAPSSVALAAGLCGRRRRRSWRRQRRPTHGRWRPLPSSGLVRLPSCRRPPPRLPSRPCRMREISGGSSSSLSSSGRFFVPEDQWWSPRGGGRQIWSPGGWGPPDLEPPGSDRCLLHTSPRLPVAASFTV
uniref:Ubiquitin-like domain-containing protein n=1 Tax=Oryza meridionalis TaxID=40149 RepID=A0A0E0C7G2_9ORYZ